MDDPQSEAERLDKLGKFERELERLKAGLGLLGVLPCARCGVYYSHTDPGALFHCGDFVCYGCVPEWWERHCPELSTHDRQKAELDLRRWLVMHHQAQVIGNAEHLPAPERTLTKIVTGCEQCDSTGKTERGKRCSHCDGRGSVWVVVRKPDF